MQKVSGSNPDACTYSFAMDIVKLLLITSLATIIPGQIIRLPLTSAQSLTLSAISVVITGISFLIYTFFKKRKLLIPGKIFYSFLIFTGIALASTIFALNFLSLTNVLTSLLFLIRFIFYFLIAIIALNFIKENETQNWLNLILTIAVIFAFLGIFQIIAVPDLSFLTVYGWDPHLNRLVSTLIDPNFTGLILTFFLTISMALYQFKKKNIYLALSFMFLTSIILTFSRSSYLAFLASMVVLGAVKSPKTMLLTLLIFVIAIISISKSREKIAGVFTPDETVQARIESWQNAYFIFQNNWLFGIGFNTFRYVQADFGTFSIDKPEGGHSGSGTDSSLLLVAVTTGIVGLTSFTIFLFLIFKSLLHKIRSNYLKLISFASLCALLVHSQFVNSFFFPQVMLVFWFLIGLSLVRPIRRSHESENLDS